jgi:membrane-bound lytic murein transglycosylase MltF
MDRVPILLLTTAALLAVPGCSRRAEPKAAPAAAPAAPRPAPPTTVAAATPPPAAAPLPQDGPELVLPEEFRRIARPFTGDLPAMVKRRMVRVLVAYSATLYFVDRGQQSGATYDAGRLLEDELNRRYAKGALKMRVVFVPVSRDRMLRALREGYGDIAAANLTVTAGRLRTVAFSEPVAKGVDEVVVSGPGAPEIRSASDLSGREVHVRASSSFAESLRALSAELARAGRAPVKIVPVDERLETEDVLEMTNAGLYPLTIADGHVARLWAQVFTGLRVHEDVAVRKDTSIAWALRSGNPQLKRFVDAFVKKNRVGTRLGNVISNRYFKSADWIKSPTSERDLERFRSMVSLFRKYGERYSFDYLLVTAQAYQESGLDQSKRSPVGAVGVMQLMPTTARDPNVNVPDIQVLENNIHAGVKYLRFLIDQYFDDPGIAPVDRGLLAIAAYNAGPARVSGLRARARRTGLDPNRWFGNVELVAAREIGRETVQYVSNIFKYYLAYKLVTQRAQEKQAARQAVQR